MTIGQRIKAARERLNPKPTQKDIADLFGISDKAVSSWERDETSPELEKITDLARRLRVPVAWLVSGSGPPPPENDLTTRLEALTPAQRAALGLLLDALPTLSSHAA